MEVEAAGLDHEAESPTPRMKKGLLQRAGTVKLAASLRSPVKVRDTYGRTPERPPQDKGDGPMDKMHLAAGVGDIKQLNALINAGMGGPVDGEQLSTHMRTVLLHSHALTSLA